MLIRPASGDDLQALNDIARAAKAHWGYAPTLLDSWAGELTTTAETLTTHRTWIVAMSQEPVAFAQVDPGATPWDLAGLWLRPMYMGRGVGRALLETVIDAARAAGQSRLTIDADPHAEPFYLACGATLTGHVRAPIPGEPQRHRPQLQIDLSRDTR